MNNRKALRPGWTPLTIGLMVLGFVLFWPLGLAMLAYILWGDQFETMFRDARCHFDRMVRDTSQAVREPVRRPSYTGNVAFDDFRKQEIARLEEERRRLDEQRGRLDAMEREFDDFLRDLRRAKDQEEFDRFMNARKASADEGPAGATPAPA